MKSFNKYTVYRIIYFSLFICLWLKTRRLLQFSCAIGCYLVNSNILKIVVSVSISNSELWNDFLANALVVLHNGTCNWIVLIKLLKGMVDRSFNSVFSIVFILKQSSTLYYVSCLSWNWLKARIPNNRCLACHLPKVIWMMKCTKFWMFFFHILMRWESEFYKHLYQSLRKRTCVVCDANKNWKFKLNLLFTEKIRTSRYIFLGSKFQL